MSRPSSLQLATGTSLGCKLHETAQPFARSWGRFSASILLHDALESPKPEERVKPVAGIPVAGIDVASLIETDMNPPGA